MKEAKTIDEQISILKGRGVGIPDESKAKEILRDIGYYRLGFYIFPFEKNFPKLKNRDHEVKEGVTFTDIVDLYYFDTDLRKILTPFLNRIEVSLRTDITYTASIKYKKKPTWFVDTRYVNSDYVLNFPDKVYRIISDNPIIKRHHKKYINDKYAPAWKTMEFMTLGNILKLYDNLKDLGLKEEIAGHYGCDVKTFANYFDTIRILRNHCAHGTCVYNMNLPKGIVGTGAAGKFQDDDRHNINGALRVVRYILGRISTNRLKDLDENIGDLMKKEWSEVVREAIEACGGLKINK